MAYSTNFSLTDHFWDPQKVCKYACIYVHKELTKKQHTCMLPAAVGYSSDLEDYDIQPRLQTGCLERVRNVAQAGESQFLEASVPIPRADLHSPLVQSTHSTKIMQEMATASLLKHLHRFLSSLIYVSDIRTDQSA